MNDAAARVIANEVKLKTKILNLNGAKLKNLELPDSGLEHITEIFLSNNELESLPNNFDHLINLENIYLNINQFESFPTSILQLPNIKRLNLEWNRLTSLPDNIGSLKKLRILDLSHNKIKYLPKSILFLNKIVNLGVNDNELTKIPTEIEGLVNLTGLSFRNNLIREIPDSIENLTRLARFDLNSNKLKELPSSFTKLNRLTIVDLEENLIEHLPEDIGLLKNLHTLDISKNKIKNLPKTLCQLSSLNSLYASNNLIEHLPDNFGDLRNLVDIRLDYNNLTKLPKSLTEIYSLNSLIVNNNQLIEIPILFENLPKLSLLGISNNNLSVFPEGLKTINQYNPNLILDYRGNPFVENALLRSENFVKMWNNIPFHLRDLLKIYFEGFSVFYTQKTGNNIEFNISNRTDALFFEFIPDNSTDPTIVENLLNQYFDILKNKLAETATEGKIIPKSDSDQANYFAQLQAISFTTNLTVARSTISDHISDQQIIVKLNSIFSDLEEDFRKASNKAAEIGRQLIYQSIDNAKLIGETTAVRSEIAHHRAAELIRAKTPQASVIVEQNQSLNITLTINNQIGDEFYAIREKLDKFLTDHQKDKGDKITSEIDELSSKNDPTPVEKKKLSTNLRRWIDSVKNTIAMGKDLGEVGDDLLKGWDKVKEFAETVLHDPQLVEAVESIRDTIQQAM